RTPLPHRARRAPAARRQPSRTQSGRRAFQRSRCQRQCGGALAEYRADNRERPERRARLQEELSDRRLRALELYLSLRFLRGLWPAPASAPIAVPAAIRRRKSILWLVTAIGHLG